MLPLAWQLAREPPSNWLTSALSSAEVLQVWLYLGKVYAGALTENTAPRCHTSLRLRSRVVDILSHGSIKAISPGTTFITAYSTNHKKAVCQITIKK